MTSSGSEIPEFTPAGGRTRAPRQPRSQLILNVFTLLASNEHMAKIAWVLKTSLLAVTGSLLAAGCVVRERREYAPPPPVVYTPPPVVPAPAPQVVVAPGEVVVQTAPPAPYVEVIPRGPHPGFVWVPGEWVWRNGWVWNRGHLDRPPRPGVNWAPGRYEMRGGVRVYVAGGWR